jgi:hypothetical protein
LHPLRKPFGIAQRRSLQDWVLPTAMERVRRKLASVDDGNRQNAEADCPLHNTFSVRPET